MAKSPKEPTGLEILAEHRSQLPAWATAVAAQTIDHSYRAMINIKNAPGKAKILELPNPAREADPIYYATLLNQIALHLSTNKSVDSRASAVKVHAQWAATIFPENDVSHESLFQSFLRVLRHFKILT